MTCPGAANTRGSVVNFRHPLKEECAIVRSLVQAVVDETYGGVLAEAPLPITDEDWTQSWIAMEGAKPIGVVLTHREWVDDLWVIAGHRRIGIGSGLLAIAEKEIANRGIPLARLRVISSNTNAIRFYQARGWKIAEEYPHERFQVFVTQMKKNLGDLTSIRGESGMPE